MLARNSPECGGAFLFAWFGTSGEYWLLFFPNIFTASVFFSCGTFHLVDFWHACTSPSFRWPGHEDNSQSTIDARIFVVSATLPFDRQKVNERIVDFAPMTYAFRDVLDTYTGGLFLSSSAEFCLRSCDSSCHTLLSSCCHHENGCCCPQDSITALPVRNNQVIWKTHSR